MIIQFMKISAILHDENEENLRKTPKTPETQTIYEIYEYKSVLPDSKI